METLNVLATFFVVLGGAFCFMAARIIWVYRASNSLLVLVFLFLSSCGVLSILSGFNLLQYHSIEDDKVLATVYFKQLSDKQFSIRLQDHLGREYNSEIQGNHWQVSARVIRWNTQLFPNALPMVRLEMMSGLDRKSRKDFSAQQATQALHPHSAMPDAWLWLNKFSQLNRLVSFQPRQTKQQPLKDQAIVKLMLTEQGLVVNRQAKADESSESMTGLQSSNRR